MLQVRWKAKAYQGAVFSGEQPRPFVPVKKTLGRNDVTSLHEFRTHPKWGAYANSDLAGGIIRRLVKERIGNRTFIDTENVPDGVEVDLSGFLAAVTLDLE